MKSIWRMTVTVISTESISNPELTVLLANLSADELGQTTQELAQRFTVTEYQLVAALPATLVTILPGSQAQPLLEQLAEWGPLTTIVMAGESIFEFKGAFPQGKMAHGYYNLYNREAEGLHGHLRLSSITQIALLDKPFRGRASYSMLFFAADGRCLFKIFLGRDEQRRLFPAQIDRFNALRQQWAHLLR
ncbi:heme utilization cystosolic carrier protein HutX [Serratia sp. S1B]|nr:heme utilization cystosolic carrier protein HutX [Serratia sp. S1B]